MLCIVEKHSIAIPANFFLLVEFGASGLEWSKAEN
jgi:hypothetical protein